MAVKLRLKKMGAKQKPFYRIVATDSRASRDGKFIEIVGTYDPLSDPATIKVDKKLILKWLNYGAETTDTVRNILKKEGIYKEFIDAKAKKTSKKDVKVETKTAAVKKPTAKATATTKKPAAKTTAANKKPAAKAATAAKKPAAKATTVKKATTKKDA